MKVIIISSYDIDILKQEQELYNFQIIYNNLKPEDNFNNYGSEAKIICISSNFENSYKKQTFFDVLFLNHNNLYSKESISILNKFLNINLSSITDNTEINHIDYSILIQNKINYNAVICGLVNNLQDNVDIITNYSYISALFKSSKVIVNDPNYNYLNKINDFIILNHSHKSVGYIKNKILDYIKTIITDVDYVIWFDSDSIVTFDYKKLYIPFKNTNWSMVGGNTLIYNDLENLRLINKPNLEIKTKFKILSWSKLIEVASCFNHIGIYKYSDIKGCRYCENESNEHIEFHKQMKQKHNAKLYIHPKLLIGKYNKELKLSDVIVQYNNLLVNNTYKHMLILVVNNINNLNKIESKIYEIFYNLSKIYEFNIIKLDNNTNIKNIINSKISLNKIPIFIFTKVFKIEYFDYLRSFGNLFIFDNINNINFEDFIKNKINLKAINKKKNEPKFKISNFDNKSKTKYEDLLNLKEKEIKLLKNEINVLKLKCNTLDKKLNQEYSENVSNKKIIKFKNTKLLKLNNIISNFNTNENNKNKILTQKINILNQENSNYKNQLKKNISKMNQVIDTLSQENLDYKNQLKNIEYNKLDLKINNIKSFCRLSFAHVINPFKCDESNKSYIYYAQPITFKSLLNAKNNLNYNIKVFNYSICFKNDNSIIPSYFINLPNLNRSTLSEYHLLNNNKQLPFIQDIFDNLLQHSDTDFLIYTNIDIGVHENFYNRIFEIIIENNFDCLIVNRKDIPKFDENNNRIDENMLNYIYNLKGDDHPGIDCFIIKREILSKIDMKNLFIGYPPWGFVLYELLKKYTDKIMIINNEFLTFHLGKDRNWDNTKNELYIQNFKNSEEIIKINNLNINNSKEINLIL